MPWKRVITENGVVFGLLIFSLKKLVTLGGDAINHLVRYIM
jgi:hypothetical protein